MKDGQIGTIVGVTDDGYPIITEGYCCNHWAPAKGTGRIKECWYCKYADFRKSTELHIQTSVCRCPDNRVDTRLDFQKNEEG